LFINAGIRQVAIAQSAGDNLTPAQIDQLQSTGVKIAVPTYIPDGFQVAEIEVKPCPNGARRCRFGPSYTITYRNAGGYNFSIQSASGGFGGPVLASKLPINSPLFGREYVLYYGKYPNVSPPKEGMFSDWMKGDEGQYYMFLENDSYLSPAEAVRVIESLQYLNPGSTPGRVPDATW
jgi:hypothetical protein